MFIILDMVCSEADTEAEEDKDIHKKYLIHCEIRNFK